MKLIYHQPANVWTEALPIGNGTLGAMVFGGIDCERLQLNEDTLWSGGPQEWKVDGALDAFHDVRKLLHEQKYIEADQRSQGMMGPYTQSYLPLGDLHLNVVHQGKVENYKRELQLEKAITTVQYEVGDIEYRRTYFSSYPDKVLVIRLEVDRPGALHFDLSLTSELRAETMVVDKQLSLNGVAPAYVAPNYVRNVEEPIVYEDGKGMRFCGRVHVQATDGEQIETEQKISIRDATTATIIFSAATSFNGPFVCPNQEGIDEITKVNNAIEAASSYRYEQLLERHMSDYQPLFYQTTLELDGQVDALSTPERVKKSGARDLKLVELLFQYGRYLLIASSRAGSQPANLQGMWNPHIQPPWSSNYTLNINAEMNYWLAETCGLSDCHQPLLHFISELAKNGEEAAKANYGVRGWVAHHNSDIWRHPVAVGEIGGQPIWAMWFMGGAWLVQHLWEHYVFTLDERFLREQAYPIMRSAALFCLDWLVENEERNLVPSPSSSPELKYRLENGELAALCEGGTMDLAIIWDVFTNCLQAIDILQEDDEIQAELQTAIHRLAPYKIGQYGQIQEWSHDWEDEDIHHRHVSHLFGVYPGKQIIEQKDLIEAVKTTLNRRGDDGTGWSLAWKMNLWARLLDGERVEKLIARKFELVEEKAEREQKGGIYPNLFGAHPPFQIDGNFGFTAGIAESLIQSHGKDIHLLPALPPSWKNGKVKGLRARGGLIVDIEWENNQLTTAVITSKQTTICTIRNGTKTNHVIEKQLHAGERIIVSFNE